MSELLLRYLPVLFSIDALLIAAHLGAGRERFWNLDKEHNFPSWFSGIQLVFLGLAALDCYEREKRASRRLFPATAFWAAASVFFLYLSLDEITVIHEGVLRYDIPDLLPPDSLWVSLLSWQIVFGPLLLAMAVVLLGLFLTRFASTRALARPALAGLGCWVAAVFTEALAKPVFLGRGWYQQEVAVEEGLELFGATLLLLALCRYGSALREGPVAVIDVRSQYRRVAGAAAAAFSLVVIAAVLVAVVSLENSAWLYRHNAMQFQKREKYSAAIAAYRKALEQNPKDFDSLRGLALCYYRLRDYESAFAWSDRALQIRPSDARQWHQRALALHQLGRLAEAETAYGKAIELDPRYSRAWSNLGLALEKQARKDEALAAFQKASALDSSDKVARRHLTALRTSP